jgi:hypothetical protein
MIAEVMKIMWGSGLYGSVAFGAFSFYGNVSSVQCVFPWYLCWVLLYQWMQCGCFVKLLLCYDSLSPFGSGVGLLCFSVSIICFINE